MFLTPLGPGSVTAAPIYSWPFEGFPPTPASNHWWKWEFSPAIWMAWYGRGSVHTIGNRSLLRIFLPPLPTSDADSRPPYCIVVWWVDVHLGLPWEIHVAPGSAWVEMVYLLHNHYRNEYVGSFVSSPGPGNLQMSMLASWLSLGRRHGMFGSPLGGGRGLIELLVQSCSRAGGEPPVIPPPIPSRIAVIRPAVAAGTDMPTPPLSSISLTPSQSVSRNRDRADTPSLSYSQCSSADQPGWRAPSWRLTPTTATPSTLTEYRIFYRKRVLYD